MATKRIIPDKDFGEIIIRTHRLARNITMRTKPNGLYVTVPPLCRTNKILSVIDNYRKDLLEKWKRIEPQPLNLNFSIEAPCFRLKVKEGYILSSANRFYRRIRTKIIKECHQTRSKTKSK